MSLNYPVSITSSKGVIMFCDIETYSLDLKRNGNNVSHHDKGKSFPVFLLDMTTTMIASVDE